MRTRNCSINCDGIRRLTVVGVDMVGNNEILVKLWGQ